MLQPKFQSSNIKKNDICILILINEYFKIIRIVCSNFYSTTRKHLHCEIAAITLTKFCLQVAQGYHFSKGFYSIMPPLWITSREIKSESNKHLLGKMSITFSMFIIWLKVQFGDFFFFPNISFYSAFTKTPILFLCTLSALTIIKVKAA